MGEKEQNNLIYSSIILVNLITRKSNLVKVSLSVEHKIMYKDMTQII